MFAAILVERTLVSRSTKSRSRTAWRVATGRTPLLLLSFSTNDQRVLRLRGRLIVNKKYRNEDFASFADVLRRFLSEDARVGRPPVTACFAVAGPVKDNAVRFTNRDSWSIDGGLVADELGIPVVRLVNDFLAVGYGILTLDVDKECIPLQKGMKDVSAPIACIGAGTGLGECFLTPSADGEYQCFPCEGGHADFAPRNEVIVIILSFSCLLFTFALAFCCSWKWSSWFT